LLDFQYGAYLAQFKGTNWQSTRNLTLAGIAILDPAAERWQVIPCPEVEVINHNRFYHRTTLFQGRVFTSYEGQIRRFDVPTRRWQKIALPDLGNCELFALNDHLYAATENLMVEILDDGVRAQILASNRRQPPASALDTEELGTPILFAGPDRSLRAAIGNKIAAWNGSDWRTVCPAPDTIIPPAISQDGLLFMAAGQRGWSSIWHLAMAGDEMELYLGASSGVEHPGPQAQPVWKLPSDIHSPALPAASRNGNLYLLVDHAKSEPIVDDQSKVNVGQRVVPQNGYHAQLLCFARHLGTPQMIPLNFAAPNADAPVYGGRPAGGFMMPVVPSAWLSFSSNWLCLARETPDAIPNANGGGNRRAGQPKAGIWMVALAEIDAEFARQQAAQQEQQAHAESLDRQSASDLLAKYDRNHNGIIDPDEREEALDDPAFIKTHLDEIDANHNGWLDAPELAWFDANQNKELDPKERTGIDLAEQYLAEKLLNQSDRDGNRWLTPVPYDAMIHDSLHESSAAEFDLQFAHVDINHDNRIDLDELKNLMRQRLQGQLSRNVRRNPHEFGGAQPPGFHPMGLRPRQPVNPAQKFKSAVEAYWQNQAGANNP
jgi:Ca2+-binding EF-hand superfamily protein